MQTIVEGKSASGSCQLHARLASLNQSLQGKLPDINRPLVDDILRINVTETPLAWNWSKSFNY